MNEDPKWRFWRCFETIWLLESTHKNALVSVFSWAGPQTCDQSKHRFPQIGLWGGTEESYQESNTTVVLLGHVLTCIVRLFFVYFFHSLYVTPRTDSLHRIEIDITPINFIYFNILYGLSIAMLYYMNFNGCWKMYCKRFKLCLKHHFCIEMWISYIRFGCRHYSLNNGNPLHIDTSQIERKIKQ